MQKRIFLLVTLFLFLLCFSQKKWGLQECVTYAYENNLTVLQSKINEKIQDKTLKITQNEWLPTMNGNINNSLLFGPKLNILTGNYDYKTNYSHNFGADAQMILWQKNKLKLDNKKAATNLEIQQLNTESIKNDIALQLISYYLQIVLNKELLLVSDKQMKLGADQLDKTKKLYKAGSIPYSNLTTEQANFSTNKQNYENALINIERAKLQLALLLQLDSYKNFDIQEVTLPDKLTMGLENIDDIVNYAYKNQPAIQQAEKQKEASFFDVDIAKTALWPVVTGGYNIGTTYGNAFDGNNESLFSQWNHNHSQGVTLGVSIPIFNKGNSKLRIEQAQINTEIYDNTIEQEKLRLKQNIQTAYFDYSAAYNTYKNAVETQKSNQISFDYATLSYKAGKINIYDYNIARNNLAISESRTVQAKYDFIFKIKVLDFYAGKPLSL